MQTVAAIAQAYARLRSLFSLPTLIRQRRNRDALQAGRLRTPGTVNCAREKSYGQRWPGVADTQLLGWQPH